METNWDLLEVLDPDVSSKILMCLDDPADLVRACSVSRRWHEFDSQLSLASFTENPYHTFGPHAVVLQADQTMSAIPQLQLKLLIITNGMCKHLCLRLFPQLSAITRVVDIRNTQEKYTDVGCSSSIEWKHLKEEHSVYTSLARGLTSSEVGECLSEAISASSTDNYPEEGVHNTLESRDRIGDAPLYWSSSGKSNPDVPERLTYQLISDLCVITEINIQPFQAFFQPNSPIYSAKAVRFHMGYRIFPDNSEEDIRDHEGWRGGEGKFVWTYTSQEFPMVQENTLQNFKLPQPVLCIGGHLQIELLGRVQTQEMDGLFYICVAYVQAQGRPLSPYLGVQSPKPTGRFVLTYNPQEAQFSPPPAIDARNNETVVTPEEVMVNRHVRGWEQILLMLRGTLGVEVNDSDDEHDTDEEMADEFAA